VILARLGKDRVISKQRARKKEKREIVGVGVLNQKIALRNFPC